VDPEASHLRIWFATPAAAGAFDPDALSDAERATWADLRSERRRADWAVSRVLLQGNALPAACARSLTHSRAHAAVATGPSGGAVGIDLEWLAPRDYAGLAEIGFSATEAAFIATIDDPPQQRAAFYELWTLKEACTKALGLPLVDGLRQCRFVNANREWHAELPTDRPWEVIAYAPRPDLLLAVAWVAGADALAAPMVTIREWPDPQPVVWPERHRFAHPDRHRPDRHRDDPC
jgi:hypothetical protein